MLIAVFTSFFHDLPSFFDSLCVIARRSSLVAVSLCVFSGKGKVDKLKGEDKLSQSSFVNTSLLLGIVQ